MTVSSALFALSTQRRDRSWNWTWAQQSIFCIWMKTHGLCAKSLTYLERFHYNEETGWWASATHSRPKTGEVTLLSANFRLISAHLCGKNIQTICLNATCSMRLLNRAVMLYSTNSDRVWECFMSTLWFWCKCHKMHKQGSTEVIKRLIDP